MSDLPVMPLEEVIQKLKNWSPELLRVADGKTFWGSAYFEALYSDLQAALHHLEAGKVEDDEPYSVKICRNVIFYACFSRHTDNLKAGEMKAAIAVLFPPDVVGLASKPPTSPQQP